MRSDKIRIYESEEGGMRCRGWESPINPSVKLITEGELRKLSRAAIDPRPLPFAHGSARINLNFNLVHLYPRPLISPSRGGHSRGARHTNTSAPAELYGTSHSRLQSGVLHALITTPITIGQMLSPTPYPFPRSRESLRGDGRFSFFSPARRA